MKKTIYQNIVRSLNNIISLALDENLNERLEKMGDCFCTTSAYDIVNLLKNKPKEYRILYDKNINTYMIGDADSITHWDMLQEAKRNALYYSQEDFINSLGDFQNYVDLGQDGGWDENDNEIEPFLYYIVFSPNEEWELGTDGYNKRYDYPFGHVFTRGCDLSEIDLWDALGVPQNSEKINESADNLNDAFWKWFGNSKVVNNQGKPLVVYHGTNTDFNTFDKSFINSHEKRGDFLGEGFYFHKKKEIAANYGNNIIACYLRIENPLIINSEDEAKNFRERFGFIDFKGIKLPRYFKNTDLTNTSPKYISEKVKEFGYDGLIDNLYGQYAVFEPNQIKSINNKGTWSNSDNIYETLNKEIERYL